MVQKIIREDRHSALYIHYICIFIIYKTNSHLKQAENLRWYGLTIIKRNSNMFCYPDQLWSQLSCHRTKGTRCCSASKTELTYFMWCTNCCGSRRPLRVRKGLLWFLSLFFSFLKTKCPISSQTHLIDLNVLKKTKPKNPQQLLFSSSTCFQCLLFHYFSLHELGFNGVI